MLAIRSIIACVVLVQVAASDETPLADAAERMEWPRVRALIQQKRDVDESQVDGMTALHWAVHHDAADTARLLVAAGAGVNRANRYGVTPLSLACTNGNGAIVELLLDAGADANVVLRGGETALMTAARTGKVEPVRWLIRHGAKLEAKERHGQSALMWAAAEGHAPVVQLLIDAGADFKTPLPSGFAPLHFAARDGRREVAEVLLRAGADVHQCIESKKRSGKAPRPGTSALILAIENGHFELAAALVDAGADPNDERSGFTPLHTLTWVRKPNRGDGDDGDPAPAGSGSMTSLEFARLLVERGADVNRRLARGVSGRGILSRVGATPFLLAAATADLPYMKTLLELGADPQIPNADGAVPLLAAAGVGTLAPGEEAGTEEEVLEAIQLLLELGNRLDSVDQNGETAMHGAAYKSLPRVVRFLAERGADRHVWNKPNKYGWTPLSIAQGYRVGNFKPSAETIAAIQDVISAGER